MVNACGCRGEGGGVVVGSGGGRERGREGGGRVGEKKRVEREREGGGRGREGEKKRVRAGERERSCLPGMNRVCVSVSVCYLRDAALQARE